MAYTLHTQPDAAVFLTKAGPMLLGAEAQNNLMLGLAGRLRADPDFEGPSYFAVICDGDDVVAAAMRTSPPRKLLLSSVPTGALTLLLDAVEDLAFSGVNGPPETAHAFASRWSRHTGITTSVHMNLRIYQLDKVEPVAQPPGSFRHATERDTETLVSFVAGFSAAVGESEDADSARKSAESRIAKGNLYVWDDGEPVCCASASDLTPNGVRLSLVYTPPKHQRKGYATACVAALSQHLLDSGRSFCFLFTDLANPTSNSIYQKIGYRPVCDFIDIGFDG